MAPRDPITIVGKQLRGDLAQWKREREKETIVFDRHSQT